MYPVAPVCPSPPRPGRLHRGILHRRIPIDDEIQYCYEQERAQHAALPQSNIDLKLLRCSSHHHSCCCLLVNALSGYCVNSFSRSTNPRAILPWTPSLFSTIGLRTSAVPLPFLNPCCSSHNSPSTLSWVMHIPLPPPYRHYQVHPAHLRYPSLLYVYTCSVTFRFLSTWLTLL